MKVILFGATGMVGQGVLRECLLDAGVESGASGSGAVRPGNGTPSCAKSCMTTLWIFLRSNPSSRDTTPASFASASVRSA